MTDLDREQGRGAPEGGASLGRYHLVEPIGAGPTGEVFRAKVYGVAGFERQFAVKRFWEALVPDPAGKVLADAARAYGKLAHPRIARLQEYGVDGARAFVAVELVAGLDLARLLEATAGNGEPLPAGAALGIVAQLARAVGYAHGRGVHHGGICPTNVVATPDGDAKILDFGLLPARLLAGAPVADPGLAPRLPYLAPEQLAAGASGSAASDVFQLGAVAHELLSGARAFTGRTREEIAARIQRAPPQPPPVPAPIAAVLKRALAADPAARWPDANAFADALDAAIRQTPMPGGRSDVASAIKRALAAGSVAGAREGSVTAALWVPPLPPATATPSQEGIPAAVTEASPQAPGAPGRSGGASFPTMLGWSPVRAGASPGGPAGSSPTAVPEPAASARPAAPVAAEWKDPELPSIRSLSSLPSLDAGASPAPLAHRASPAAHGASPPAHRAPDHGAPPPAHGAPLSAPPPPSLEPAARAAPPPLPPGAGAPPAGAVPAAEPGPPTPSPEDGVVELVELEIEPDGWGSGPGGLPLRAPPTAVMQLPPLDGGLAGASPPRRRRAGAFVAAGVLVVAALAAGAWLGRDRLGLGGGGASVPRGAAPVTGAGAAVSPAGPDERLRAPDAAPATAGDRVADAGAVALGAPVDAPFAGASPADAAALAAGPLDAPAVAAARSPDAAPRAATGGTPAPATPEGDGPLVIESDPPGAAIYLDGAPKGKTPLELAGSADRHKLALVLPGRKLHRDEIDGRGRVSVSLDAAPRFKGPAGIKVKCRARNRYYVIVDGQDTGMLCPTDRIHVGLGAHTVEIYDVVTDEQSRQQVNVRDTHSSARVSVDE